MRWILPVGLLVSSCRSPTQYRVVVRNEAPCPARVIVRTASSLAALPPGKSGVKSSARTCGGAADDIVVVPNGGDDFAIELATRTDGGDPESCTEGAPACIVQRWSMAFRAHTEQTFSTTLALACAAVRCPGDTTCAAGACVPNRIDRVCTGQGCAPEGDGALPDTADTGDTGDTSVEDADAPPPPVTVRLLNGGTLGNAGTLDACYKNAAGESPPLLASRKVAPLGAWEVSGSIPLPDDTADTVTLILTSSDCSMGKTASIKRPPPGGRIFAFRRDGFSAGLALDTPPAPNAAVQVRFFHGAMRAREQTIDGGYKIESMTDIWPDAYKNIAFGASSPSLDWPARVTHASARNMAGFGANTPPIPERAPGRTYVAFVFAEEMSSTLRVCDDQLSDVNLRALCEP